MSRHATRARSGSDRTSLYDEVTGKILAELEAGRLPWVQPWGTAAAKAPLAMPKNAATGRVYSGVNVLILWGAVFDHGFPTQSWLTFRQALSLGGHVRKGERGTTVVYADRFVPDDEKQRARETGEEAQAIPFLKRFTVFNLAQCEGLPDDLAIVAPPPEPGLIGPQRGHECLLVVGRYVGGLTDQRCALPDDRSRSGDQHRGHRRNGDIHAMYTRVSQHGREVREPVQRWPHRRGPAERGVDLLHQDHHFSLNDKVLSHYATLAHMTSCCHRPRRRIT